MRLFSARSGDDEHMHLFDIAYWIAGGLLPEPGYRFDRDRIIDMHGAQWGSKPWLSAEEISSLLPGVPVDKYIHLREICGLQTPEELTELGKGRASYLPGLRAAALDDPELAISIGEADERERNEMAAARQIKAFDAPLTRALDRAKLDILQALMDGKLTGTGLLETEVGAEDDIEWQIGDFEEIPPERWSLSGVDFDNSNLKIEGAVYLAVTVPIETCLKVFPSPRLDPVRVSGWLHGSTLILDDAIESNIGEAPTKSRGRPSKADGFAPIVVKNAMRILLKSGKLPNKKEAIIAEAQAWYKAYFGQPLARSTAQRYLAPIFSDLPETEQ
jgi:hypothetical protein